MSAQFHDGLDPQAPSAGHALASSQRSIGEAGAHA